MRTIPLPERLVEALYASTPRPRTEHADGPLRRGDLRFVRGVGTADTPLPRLALVLREGPVPASAEILIAHPYPEFACDLDALVPPRLAGTPYPIVLQSDLRGLVWTSQCGAVQGRLTESTLTAVNEALAGGDVVGHAGVHIGARLAGVADPRWRFKRVEGAALRSLASDCTVHVLDGD